MKKYYTFVFALIVLVSVLVGSMIVKQNEMLSPLGTSTSFDLYLGEANISQDQVIHDLEQIASDNKAVLVKPNTDSKKL